jgi:hypothetical protein
MGMYFEITRVCILKLHNFLCSAGFEIPRNRDGRFSKNVFISLPEALINALTIVGVLPRV